MFVGRTFYAQNKRQNTLIVGCLALHTSYMNMGGEGSFEGIVWYKQLLFRKKNFKNFKNLKNGQYLL